jgi:death-on-curing family protein
LDILYLSIEDVIETHAEVMRRLGLAVPVLSSRFKLESALERVQNVAYYEAASFAFQAATLGVSIAQAQAFSDGNKRAGTATTIVFIRRNGYRFCGSVMQVAKFIELQAYVSMVDGFGDFPEQLGRETFALWLESVIEPDSSIG